MKENLTLEGKIENIKKDIIIEKANIEKELQEIDKKRNDLITELIKIEGKIDILNTLE